jgi:cobalamin biosynthesis protein CbiG
MAEDPNNTLDSSQFSETRGGLRSFSEPSDIAKGGGSKLDDPDFGSSAIKVRGQLGE